MDSDNNTAITTAANSESELEDKQLEENKQEQLETQAIGEAEEKDRQINAEALQLIEKVANMQLQMKES